MALGGLARRLEAHLNSACGHGQRARFMWKAQVISGISCAQDRGPCRIYEARALSSSFQDDMFHPPPPDLKDPPSQAPFLLPSRSPARDPVGKAHAPSGKLTNAFLVALPATWVRLPEQVAFKVFTLRYPDQNLPTWTSPPYLASTPSLPALEFWLGLGQGAKVGCQFS